MESVLDDDLLQSYSDAELTRHVLGSHPLWDSSRLSLLSANLIAKHYEPTEVEDVVQAMEFAQRLGIRAPSIKRVIRDQQNAYCIMDRIEGNTLERVWLNLSWFFTIKLAAASHHQTSSISNIVHCWVTGIWSVRVILARRSFRDPPKI